MADGLRPEKSDRMAGNPESSTIDHVGTETDFK
jgi:hypothetical protein